MLTQLTISQFAIVDYLNIEFTQGMSVITGETGAGKSIAIDALNLCLGERSDASMIRAGAERADICATFSLASSPYAKHYLQDQQLDQDDDHCILRRVINQDGRSRAFINGSPVAISQLKELAQYLLQIHGQHAHQLLLKADYQRQLLDHYSGHTELYQAMQQAYRQWHQAKQALADYQQHQQDWQARQELLHYQLTELDEFAPLADEYQQLDDEYKRLANHEQIQQTSRQARLLLSEQEEYNCLSLLHLAQQQLQQLGRLDNHVNNISSLLADAQIQLQEASNELQHYDQQSELDAERWQYVEQRLSLYLSLARKHHIKAEELADFHQQLQQEAQQLNQQEQQGEQLQQQLTEDYQQAQQLAKQLHQCRQQAASQLAEQISHHLQQLAMPEGKLVIQLDHDPQKLTPHGADHIDFLVSTNPGQAPQPLAKIASGGELSRIVLAIQVITAQKIQTPTLIFDEVDVGISGATAAIVGAMLRQLSQFSQIICVTHLPQVAGYGHQHFFVEKISQAQSTQTKMQALDKQGRIAELARLLAGTQVTKNTLANAQELLQNSK